MFPQRCRARPGRKPLPSMVFPHAPALVAPGSPDAGGALALVVACLSFYRGFRCDLNGVHYG